MLCVGFRFVCSAAACLFSAGVLTAQNTQDEAARLREKFREAPLPFEIVGGPTGTEKFDLLQQPILNWSNPERRTPAGALFLWTLKGRPQVAMGLYPVADETLDHEFQSLSPFPLKAVRSGITVWEPTEPGMEMEPLDQAMAPSESEPARLRQMRGLAREFTAKLVPPRKNSISLRLLSAPLYRYPRGQSAKIIDGAVFAFVQGTDPEVLLVIEAVENSSGDPKWQYGMARMTMVPLEALYRQQPVWKTDPGWAVQTLNTSYLVVKDELGTVQK